MKATYLNHMGSDLEVVNDARVSFGKASEWEPVVETYQNYDISHGYETCERVVGKKLSEADQGLIRFLARGCSTGDWARYIHTLMAGECSGREIEDLLHHIRQMPPHWTPFAGSIIKLHLKLPIVIARQMLRSEQGRVFNEVSRRYVSETPEMYHPELRLKAPNVKQGSSDEVLDDFELEDDLRYGVKQQITYYDNMIEKGVAPEVARFYLPQGVYTELRVTGSLCFWARVVVQRRDPHAQKEIREVARQIDEIIAPLFPVSWKELTL